MTTQLTIYSLSKVSFTNLTEPITLLDREEGADAEFIVNNLAMLKDRENESVVADFVEIIESAFKESKCFYKEEQINLLETLMEFYYKEKNMTAPKPLKFTQDILKNLDLEKIKKIAESGAFYCAVNYNGVIDEVAQGYECGDCWLLAAAMGYSSTPAGSEVIANAISWNEDFTEAYLKLCDSQGVERIITISADDIKAACKQQYEFSYTDREKYYYVNMNGKEVEIIIEVGNDGKTRYYYIDADGNKVEANVDKDKIKEAYRIVNTTSAISEGYENVKIAILEIGFQL